MYIDLIFFENPNILDIDPNPKKITPRISIIFNLIISRGLLDNLKLSINANNRKKC